MTRGLQGWCYATAFREHFAVATAALVVGLESQVPSIYTQQIVPLLEKYGFTEDEIEFFDLHITSDEIHGERGYQIVLENANTAGAAAALPAARPLGRGDALLVHQGAVRHVRRARPRRRCAGLTAGPTGVPGATRPAPRAVSRGRRAACSTPIIAGPHAGTPHDHDRRFLVSEPTATTTAPRVDQPDTGASWVHVAEMKELARRKRKQVSVAGCPIALFLVDDEVFAMDDICIHQERSLSKGTLLNGQVICPGHQWKFDPRTGEAEDQDGCQATYAVQVTEEGAILVAPEPVTPGRRQATSPPRTAGAEAS